MSDPKNAISAYHPPAPKGESKRVETAIYSVAGMGIVWQWIRQRFRQYDLLPEYFATIRYLWVDVAWGAGVPAVIFIMWWSLEYPFPIPRWAIATFFDWALIMAGYHSWHTDHVRLKPKIKAHTESDVGQSHAGKGPETGCGKCVTRVFERSPATCCLHLLFLGFTGAHQNHNLS